MGRAALASSTISATISVSRQNESFDAFRELGDAVLPVDTFSGNVGAALQAWRIPMLRRRLVEHIEERRVQVVIELMPHVWSSFVVPSIRKAGARYATIIHDATSHPGDYRTASIEKLMARSARQADVVLTLSSSVARRLNVEGKVQRHRIFPLFHPDLYFGGTGLGVPPLPGEPWRLLFLGRIMPYKGLPLFIDMVEELIGQGFPVQAGVYGDGHIGASASRLTAIGADVVNRWLTEAEIAALLPRFHAVVLSHTEASQSGVAAVAFGAGLPVIATPVGSLIEQIQDNVTGVLAQRADAVALADATRRLLDDPTLYTAISRHLMTSKGHRSMATFLEQCVSHALYSAEK